MATAAGRYGNLGRLFKLTARSLLTAFSREEEFDAFCQEIQVGTALDKVDQFVEEQNLDVLSSDNSFSYRTSIEDIKERISKAKQDEIEYMMGLLEKDGQVEERNNAMKARIELLKKEEDLNATRTVLEKLTQWNSACQRYNIELV